MMKIRVNPHVFSNKINGTWVILEKDSKFYHELNDSASLLWEALRLPKTEEELVDVLSRQYDIDRQSALRDVRQFVKAYQKSGFLTVQ